MFKSVSVSIDKFFKHPPLLKTKKVFDILFFENRGFTLLGLLK